MLASTLMWNTFRSEHITEELKPCLSLCRAQSGAVELLRTRHVLIEINCNLYKLLLYSLKPCYYRNALLSTYICDYRNVKSAGVSHGDVILFLRPACHLEAVALHSVSEQLVLPLSPLIGIQHPEFRIWIA